MYQKQNRLVEQRQPQVMKHTFQYIFQMFLVKNEQNETRIFLFLFMYKTVFA